MELGANPHSVGIDQLTNYEGATIESPLGDDGSNPGISGIDFLNHLLGRLGCSEVVRLVFLLTSRCLVEVIQAEAAKGVLLQDA